ncbi:hypothetical protein EJB05_03334, partial [Eragrostis curvula]
MAPVILHMDVHCLRCARKIRRTIEHLHGVERVWAAPESGLVFVSGTADASKLKWRIESKIGTPVTVVSDGERCFPTYTPGSTISARRRATRRLTRTTAAAAAAGGSSTTTTTP